MVDPITLKMILGVGSGAFQLAKGAMEKKKSDAMRPGPEDLDQRLLLDEIRRRRRALSAGIAYDGAAGRIRENLLSTQRRMSQITGGDVGGTVAAMNRAQASSSQTMNALFDRTATLADQNIAREEGLSRIMSQRKLDLAMHKVTGAAARSAQNKQDGMANLYGGVASSSLMPNVEEEEDESAFSILSRILKGKGK